MLRIVALDINVCARPDEFCQTLLEYIAHINDSWSVYTANCCKQRKKCAGKVRKC
jgi:hypothetical protein